MQIRPGLVALSQRILGPNTLIQGAVRTILFETPKEFYDKTIAIVQVRNPPNYFLNVSTGSCQMVSCELYGIVLRSKFLGLYSGEISVH